MKRRQFIARLGGATLAFPLAVRGQQAVPIIGFLNTGAPKEFAHLVSTFRQGLEQGGYVDGQNIRIEYRWAEGHHERLPALVAELVDRKVAVIAATGSPAPALAAKAATSTIPIVFTGGQDPVKLGLVASLSRPGGNVTGITNIAALLNAKRLEILRELIPSATKVAYLMNPNLPSAKSPLQEIQTAANASGTDIHIFQAGTEGEIDAAFAAIRRIRANALVVAADVFFTTRRDQIVALAARQSIPASYSFREFPVAGGLMSYGPDLAYVYRQAGAYVARILKGTKPADLPVVQADKFELVLNLKTAKALRLPISRDFLARVDEAIQ